MSGGGGQSLLPLSNRASLLDAVFIEHSGATGRPSDEAPFWTGRLAALFLESA